MSVGWKALGKREGVLRKMDIMWGPEKVAAYNGATARYFVTALHPPFVNGKGKAPCKCELWSLREKHYNKLHHRTVICRYHSRYDKSFKLNLTKPRTTTYIFKQWVFKETSNTHSFFYNFYHTTTVTTLHLWI